MRMAELVVRSGVPKTTILFYLREGLLPPAEKPFPNQARYTQAHVDRLQLIKHLQQEFHLPLDKIRRSLDLVDRGVSPAAVARLSDRMFASRMVGSTTRTWSLEEFCAETGLDRDTVHEALRVQVLNPYRRGGEAGVEFDNEDVRVGLALRAVHAFGLTFADLTVLVDHARAIAAHEMALRERVVAGRDAHDDVEMTAELTDIARTLHTYVVDRMFIETALQQSVAGTVLAGAEDMPAT